MRNSRTVLLAATLAGLALSGLATTRIAAAQAPGFDPGQGGPPPGGRGRGGFGRQMPFAMGVVTASDSTANTITIRPQFGGDSQTIQLSSTTTFVTQTTVSISDLKVNDHVQIQGVPTGITASSVTAGQVPSLMPAGGGFGGPGGGGFGGGGNRPGGGGAGGGNRRGGQGANAGPAFASATGTITSLSPFTVSLSSDVSITIKLAANAKITKYTTVALSDIKVGDHLQAAGQANSDGTFAATSVGVNITTTNGFGMGGFGQGGQGRRRGGFNGGPGGGAPPPPPDDNNGAPPPPPDPNNQ